MPIFRYNLLFLFYTSISSPGLLNCKLQPSVIRNTVTQVRKRRRSVCTDCRLIDWCCRHVGQSGQPSVKSTSACHLYFQSENSLSTQHYIMIHGIFTCWNRICTSSLDSMIAVCELVGFHQMGRG